MKKIKINENNRKTIISIGIFLVVSIFLGSYYFFAFAEDETDSLADKLTINGSTIVDVIDGTPDFNEITDTNGNDSSSRNNVVRTFDNVSYQVRYSLLVKENPTPTPTPEPDPEEIPGDNDTDPEGTGEGDDNNSGDSESGTNEGGENAGGDNTSGENTGENNGENNNTPVTPITGITGDDRTIVVDVIFPSNIKGRIRTGENYLDLIPVFNNYSYVEFTATGKVEENNSLDFSIIDVYSANGTIFTPEVYIKESTDTANKSIRELTDEQRSQSLDDNIRSLLGNKSGCTNIIGEGTEERPECSVKVTGRESYFIKLFTGSQSTEALETKAAVGFAIGMEPNENQNIGIKGLMNPTSVSFDVDFSSKINSLPTTANTITYDAEGRNAIRPYRHDPENYGYSIYMDQNYQHPLPDTYDEVSESYNGNVSATFTNNVLNISVTDIDFNNKVDELNGKNVYFLSTNSLAIKSTRSSYTEDIEDIIIDITAKKNGNQIDAVSVTDKLGRWVGIYKSKIDYYDLSERESGNPREDGLAIFNYGQEFYMKDTIHYGVDGGNGLASLTNFIKIDNDAIKLVLHSQSNMEYEIVSNAKATSINPTITATYYYGTWDLDHVKMKSNAPQSCPDISTLTKENLMNLYGGPCIELKNVRTEHNYVDDYIKGDYSYGPMAIELRLLPRENGEIDAGALWQVWFKAKILDNTSIERTVRQVTTNSIGEFKNNVGQNVLYYLSDRINYSDSAKMINKDNYVKTDYDFVNRRINSSHSTTCSGTTFTNCSVTGNSLLVSALRVSKPSISTYLTNMPSRETTEFYYYPIEWRIRGSAYRTQTVQGVRFKNAYLKVYIPAYLQKIEYGQNEDIDIINYGVEDTTINDEAYKVYSYTINLQKSSDAVIDLSIYTNIYLNTPNNSNAKVFAEIDFDVTNGNNVSNAVSPIEQRKAEKTVIIHNQSDVTTQGTTIPAYIEKEGSFKFKMEAYNNSSSNYSFANAALYYVLPYKGDSSYSDMSSNFNSTGYKIKIDNLPEGYTAYYTNGQSNSIIGEEIYINNPSTHEWTEWTTPTTETSNITAIKIAKTGAFAKGEYFGGEDGITVTVTPIKSDFGDIYYNTFYIISDRPEGFNCSSQDGNDPTCNSVINTRLFYNSNRSSTSVYNRQISGFVWEDYDYSALYDNDEIKLQDIPVSVCKVSNEALNSENYDPRDPMTYVKDTDECNQDTLTDMTGSYIIRGLGEASYYVKYTFDNKKYLVTDPFKNVVVDEGISDNINSKAIQLSGTNIAVSSVITFDNNSNKFRRDYINLGLKIKKQFEVDINKYITRTELTVNGETTAKDYDNASKVTLNLKNPSGAHVQVKYKFVIENTKYFPGYVGFITDYMPTGMTFNGNIKENQDWIQYGDILYYRGLSNRLLIPGQKYYFDLVLDMDISKGGNYVNFVTATNLVLMGEEVPTYDFNNNTNSGNSTNNSGSGVATTGTEGR